MSENKDDSTENTEKEPNVVFAHYDENTDTNNGNILLGLRGAAHSEPKKENSENSTEIIIEEIDCPDLVDIEDYKNQDRFEISPENGEDENTAVLCETSLESNINDCQTAKKVVNTDSANEETIEDLPNELLVYTCFPTNEDILNKYPCKTCGAVVGCIFCLKSHYESIHLNLGIIQYRCDQTSYLKNYTEICHKCNLVCENKEEMIEHRKIHFVSCDVCDMSFDSALFLSNHCKTTHEKFEVIISCDLCEEWFKHLQDLSDHYASYHEMILCIVCFKRFATNNEMTQHHKTHKIVLRNSETVLPYACSKCNQAFAAISELSSHLTKDHPKKKLFTGRSTLTVNINKPRKKKSKRELFSDCGGLSQEILVIARDSKSKRLKTEDDDDDD